MASNVTKLRVAFQLGKRSVPDTSEKRRQDMIETNKDRNRTRVQYPFRVIKQKFGLQKAGSTGWQRTGARSMCRRR